MFFILCGISSAAIIHVPGDQPTIQAGIDAGYDGDIVLVADGTYTGAGNRDIEFNGKALIVMSAGGHESCIIDCQGTEEEHHRGFYFHESEDFNSVLKGFTVRNGYHMAGGGILCDFSSPSITDCKIIQNTATQGGGIKFNHSTSVISKCMIRENTAVWGGGLYTNGSLQRISQCIFTDNIAQNGGGIFCYNNSNAFIFDCIFTANTGENHGGGICVEYNSDPRISNCTIVGNTSDSGGGIYSGGSSPEVLRCIIWDNLTNEIFTVSGYPEITYCDIKGGFEGEGNIDADPLFVSGSYGIYYLSQISAGQVEDSPCLDAGDYPAESICFQMVGEPLCMDDLTTRSDDVIDQDTVDIGYHYFPSGYVTPTPTNTPTVTPTHLPTTIHIPDDYNTIQAGIDAAFNGDTILVSDGIYTGIGNRDIDFSGKSIVVKSVNGPENCKINCQGSEQFNHRGFIFMNNEDSQTILEGFTIINGYMNSENGGGIIIYDSSPMIRFCYITNCYASEGGGIACHNEADAVITDCIITQNSSSGGHGIFCDNSSPNINNCSITDNLFGGGGGGIRCQYQSSPLIENCVIANNSAVNGGGVYCFLKSSPIIMNSIIQNNSASDDGGGFYCRRECLPIIVDCIISGNFTSDEGGGIFCESSTIFVDNCKIENNTADSGGGIICKSGSDANISNTIIAENGTLYASGFNISNKSSATVTNCVFYGNISEYGGSAIGCWASSPAIINCTFYEGSSGADSNFLCHDCSMDMVNSVVWNLTIPEVTASTSHPTAPIMPEIRFTDIKGGYEGEGNIDADPIFVQGVSGMFYLSQISSGQTVDSPCLNAGNDFAENICFETFSDVECLDEYTTRTDEMPDIGVVDMGWHYQTGIPPLTPTPTSTPFNAGVILVISGQMFTGGDDFSMIAQCRGDSGDSSADLYVILDVYGEYWFHPGWTQDAESELIDLDGFNPVDITILDFTWPEGDFGSADDLVFWGAILKPGTSLIIGDIDSVVFGYY